MEAGKVIIEGVTKSFQRKNAKSSSYDTLKDIFVDITKKFRGSSQDSSEGDSSEGNNSSKFKALDNFSLDITPGKMLGVIGRNGSGKSTLLKLITGIYHPDQGQVKHQGRICALIELGAGFHPDFSGRENIYLGGIMLGMTRKEIDKKFDKIVEYAELEHVIDSPVRTYSSGMFMRLGFSLSIFTDPDILVIDEVLSVGDEAFVRRCHDSIRELKSKGTTIIFVTHDLDSVVKWCDKAVWIKKGKLAKEGEPREVVDSYLSDLDDKEEDKLRRANEESKNNLEEEKKDKNRWGNKDVIIENVKFGDGEGETLVYSSEDEFLVTVDFEVLADVKDLVCGIGILRSDGMVVVGTNTKIDKIAPKILNTEGTLESVDKGKYQFQFKIDRLGILDGSYYLDVAVHAKNGTPYDYHHKIHSFSIHNSKSLHGIVSPIREWKVKKV